MKKALKFKGKLLALALLATAGSQLNAQEKSATMIAPAQQAVAASGDNKGAHLFVSADRDMAAKVGVVSDSWFVISHLSSGSRKFDVLVHYIVGKPVGVPEFVEGIVTVFDRVNKRYLVENKPFKASECTFAQTNLNVQTPMGGIKGNISSMNVTVKSPQVTTDLQLSNKGKMLANLGAGIIPFYGDIQYEYALPNMATTGSLTINGKQFKVSGTSWFDRQWGLAGPTLEQKKWSWMGISLDNGDYISLWDIIEPNGEHSYATVLHPDGRHEVVDVEPLITGESNYWKSNRSGQTYPTKWMVSIPQLKAKFTVESFMREQEIVSDIPGANKYEGASRLYGTMGGKRITGRAVVELLGEWK